MKVRALFFDFGNVLGFFSHQLLCERIARLSRGRATESDVRAAIFASGLHIRLEAGQLDPQEFLLDLQQRFCPDASLEALEQAYAHIFQPNPAVCRLIPQLAGRVPMYLASNTDPLHWKHFSELFASTFAHFTGFVKSFEIGHRKPSMEFFQRLVQEVSSHECIFIDDLPENVAAAVSAGLQGIVYAPEVDLAAQLRTRGVPV